MTAKPELETNADKDEPWLALVRQQVASLRFGVLQIVVHEGQVTQIEKTEKLRMDRAQGVVSSVDRTSRRQT
jgi:hypothetical protein